MVPNHDAVVADVEIEPIVCVSAQASLVEVARVLDRVRSGMILVQSDELIIVTEHDVVRALANGRALDTPVVHIAGRGLLAVHPSTALTTALRHMLDQDVPALAVVDAQDHRVGLLTLRAVLAGLLAPLPWVGALRLALHLESDSP
jgi:CBS domain-containing protein